VVVLMQNAPAATVWVRSNAFNIPPNGYGLLAWSGRNLRLRGNEFVKVSGPAGLGAFFGAFSQSDARDNDFLSVGTGIHLGAASFMDLSCNRLRSNTVVGIAAYGSCINSSLRKNVFVSNARGFSVVNSGVVGPQGNAQGIVNDNVWAANTFDLFSESSNGTLSPFFVRNATIGTFNFVPQSSGSTMMFPAIPHTVVLNPDSSWNPRCSGPWPGGGTGGGFSTDLPADDFDVETDFETALSVAARTAAWTPIGLYDARRQIFDAWLATPQRFAESSELLSFLSSYENTPAGRLALAEWMAANGNLASALAANAAVAPENALDQAQKFVNELRFERELSGADSIDASRMRALEALARECPNRYGKAVYDARALFASLTGVFVPGDECTPPPAEERRAVAPSDYGFKIYPNPAKSTLTVRHADKNLQNATLEILDVKGRLVMSRNLDPLTVISIAELPAGFYYCRFRVAGVVVANQKLIVVK
ncbi:MAG: T9SS type A sorting domain-containing protein, partial [Bacteroidia bacterium]|nr:T9SS type A sorting domain-containing protein [Bacteroidia bacterium]